MIRAIPQATFDYRNKSVKTSLIVGAVLWLCLIALILIKGWKMDPSLGWAFFYICMFSKMIYQTLEYKNSQLVVTADSLEFTGQTKKMMRIRFDEISSIEFYSFSGGLYGAVVRSKDARIGITQTIQDWPRLKAILEGLQPCQT